MPNVEYVHMSKADNRLRHKMISFLMFRNAGYSDVRESVSDRKYVKEESKEEKEHRYSFDGEASIITELFRKNQKRRKLSKTFF